MFEVCFTRVAAGSQLTAPLQSRPFASLANRKPFVSKTIRHHQIDSQSESTASWRWFVSGLILLHFGAIGLSYAANWRRSPLQDRMLMGLQPYLIGANWYQEMLPIEWISDAQKSKSIRVSIQESDEPKDWKPVFNTKQLALDNARTERLLHLLAELASNDDTEGMTYVLKSIVLQFENQKKSSKSTVSRIRIEKNAALNAESEEEPVLYEASLARFPNGEFGFVPKIENHRTVRSLNSATVSP